MKLYLIRHGMTKGNQEHRYVGSTDESLLPEAVEVLRKKSFPPVDRLYVSPKKRCLETAAVLYRQNQPKIVEAFAECDFGEFEYCNYEELKGNREYQQFIDSMGKSGFPEGETREAFQKRCLRGFYEVMEQERLQKKQETVAIGMVVHGGTIMAVLDACSVPHRDYYDWQIKNGTALEAEVRWQGNAVCLEKIKEC
jgi:alpha-ribazole phosphatase